MPKSPLKPKKCPKQPKNVKNAKMQKVQKLKMDPCSSPTSPQPKNCPQLHKKHHSMQRKVGLSENQPKKAQKVA